MSDDGGAGESLAWLSIFRRPVLAGVIVLLTLGSVAVYAYFVETLPPLPAAESLLVEAEGKFNVEITLSFDARPDRAFELRPTSVLVRLADIDLLSTSQTFLAGRPVLIEDVPQMKVGENEFWVEVHAGEASAAADDPFSLGGEADGAEAELPVARAVRVRVFRNGLPIAESTLWSEPGHPVLGTVLVDVPDDQSQGHVH